MHVCMSVMAPIELLIIPGRRDPYTNKTEFNSIEAMELGKETLSII